LNIKFLFILQLGVLL